MSSLTKQDVRLPRMAETNKAPLPIVVKYLFFSLLFIFTEHAPIIYYKGWAE